MHVDTRFPPRAEEEGLEEEFSQATFLAVSGSGCLLRNLVHCFLRSMPAWQILPTGVELNMTRFLTSIILGRHDRLHSMSAIRLTCFISGCSAAYCSANSHSNDPGLNFDHDSS